MNIRQILDERIRAALTAAGAPQDAAAMIKPSARPEFGDYQANGVMAIAKTLKSNPRELAAKVVEALELDDVASKIEIAGPGFINIHLKNDWLANNLQHALDTGNLGVSRAEQAENIVVDYSGPNLAKEMHVGHLRSTIIGDAVVRVSSYLGHHVIRQNHVGDWGTQFGMLIAHMVSLMDNESELSMQLSDLEGFYREAKKRFDEDETFAASARDYVVKLQAGDAECRKLWHQFIDVSLQHCEAVYRQLGVLLSREDIKPESSYNPDLPKVIADLDALGLLTLDDGAQCVFLEEFKGKDDKILPAIVQKSDGGYLYATTDLAALRYRQSQLQANRILYFVDARQSLHLNQVFTIARKAGWIDADTTTEHLAFGTMMGEDGKPFKTRTGGTVKLVDLLNEAEQRAYELVKAKNPDLDEAEYREIAHKVGIGAVKYADLSKNRTSDYIFSWENMLSFEGNTAPYLQYAYTRVRSVFRKLEDETWRHNPIVIEAAAERTLALKLLEFNEVVHQVARDCYPNVLCAYLFELAGNFMSFYEACPILKAEGAVRDSRLQLAELTARVLKTGLSLLGIETLERM